MTAPTSPQPHLNNSIQQVTTNTWLISHTHFLPHSSSPPPPPPPSPPPSKTPTDAAAHWSDSNGGHFTLTTAPKPYPDSKPLTESSSPISRVHAVNNQSAVWRAGEAFIKAHHTDHPHTTREHITLQFLQDQHVHGFVFPDVYAHFECDSRYFLIVSRVEGQLLEEAWPSMDETLRRYYIGKVADICHNLAVWKGDTSAA
ncbi:hypothetical protein P168DRAFT_291291 [Aspergillus campestris IBT 28561]|uniref:Aminoglycoside phosphotransferase domain-containing protein n=1 Tax=Aspergillus campestris (strain IBT 28561) TaxID=1392248 RepID=A0A2I1CZV9_ASPC2|nr:uncharacterized protein P168DRAFT_291291 [Aspergillus campestris IBT 28561]PKY03149.1 hypothetical protein P168DRAFT_291291 [Aspergillus campestris IBT 28561]